MARLQFENPTSFSARDEFGHTAGNLTTKTAPVGGAWAGGGDANDFTMNVPGGGLLGRDFIALGFRVTFDGAKRVTIIEAEPGLAVPASELGCRL